MSEMIRYPLDNGKSICILDGGLAELPDRVDLLMCSAFIGDYAPTPASLIGALYWQYGISVYDLAQMPQIDIRSLGVWMSRELSHPLCKRVGCVELTPLFGETMTVDLVEARLRSVYDTLQFCIGKANQMGMGIRTIAMPVFGTGSQNLPYETSLQYMLTECLHALASDPTLKEITIFERRPERFHLLKDYMDASVAKRVDRRAFISYSHRDSETANVFANLLEQHGVKPWIDHRMIRNEDYAQEIVKGIAEAQTFFLLVSSNSMASKDVLREVRNAVVHADAGTLRIWPLLLEKIPYPAAFAYYLNGLDYSDISGVPNKPKLSAVCQRLTQV